jgi:hypothetical protein
MRKILFLFALIICFSCNNQRYYERLERQGKIKCGWYGKMKTPERNKIFPFNQASKVLLISYPDYEVYEYSFVKKSIGYDSILTPWGEKWLPTTNPQKYVIEKEKVKIRYPILDTLKLFDRIYSAYEMVELNQNQIDSLSNIMLNYTTNRKTGLEIRTVSCCYLPRNAIVFFDKKGVPILNYEICFECGRVQIYPDVLSTRCSKSELFRAFFKQCKIHYGIDSLKILK